MLNRLGCRCEEKMLWAMKLLDLVVWIFFPIILSEVIVKCIIGFARYVRILKDQWKSSRKRRLFSMFSKIGVCVSLKIFFFMPMGLLDLVVWICFFYYLVWTNISMCTIAIYWERFSTVLLHFCLEYEYALLLDMDSSPYLELV